MSEKIDGFYYLHENGCLIYKKYLDSGQQADFRESKFVKMFWPLDTNSRYDAWRICVEALALGADPARVKELADLWRCTDDDAKNFADCFGLQLYMDGDKWCATRADHQDLAGSPAGFGHTCLEAMAELLKDLDFNPSKTWGHTIKDLLQASP